MKFILNERLSDIVYHFCDLNAAFYMVYYDKLYLTNSIDTVRDKNFNSGRLYYMCFARHFNSNMGYPGKKNYINVRIEFNGELLSQRFKGVQVNSIPKKEDLITNREQEDRLVTNQPIIEDANQYITGIYIYDPYIYDNDIPLEKEAREKILYMMQKPKYYGKVYVFNNLAAFNNLGNFRDIKKAIKTGNIVTPNHIKTLAVNPYKVDKNFTFSKNTLKCIGYIYAIMQYGEKKSVKSFFKSNGIKKADVFWNKQIPLIKECAEKITNKFNLQMLDVYGLDLSDKDVLITVKNKMRALLFEGRIGSRVRLALSGKNKIFYPYVMNALYGYMNVKGVNSFTALISLKMNIACKRFGIPNESRLAKNNVQQYKKVAVGESLNIRKKMIENLTNKFDE